jgi:hypothetical protein
MADGNRLAGLGIGCEAEVGLLVLQVVNLGQRVRRARELGMVDYVGNPLAIDPDLYDYTRFDAPAIR